MAVFRVEKSKDYTVMSNYHLRDRSISLKAKGLLSQMLSLPEDWDYTLKGLAKINRESVDAIRTAVWELEQAGYILRTQNRDTCGKMAEMVYTIFEKPVLENPTSVNPASEQSASENPIQLNKEETKIEKQKTDSLPFHSDQQPVMGGTEDAVEVYREVIKENIDYEILRRDAWIDPAVLEELVDLIVETVCSSRKRIRIAGDDYPAKLVREKFMKLNSTHIQFVFSCMKENTTKVRNIKRYLLAALFNAPSTMNGYYNALFNHNLHKEKEA